VNLKARMLWLTCHHSKN